MRFFMFRHIPTYYFTSQPIILQYLKIFFKIIGNIVQNSVDICRISKKIKATRYFALLFVRFRGLSVSFVDIFVVGYLSIVNLGFVDFNDTVGNGIHQFLVVRSQQHTTFVIA